MNTFEAKIEIIGINPFVFIPEYVLESIFKEAGKDKGRIPVKMKIDGHEFVQTLVKYSGYWRLYLNTPMRKAAKKEVGDIACFAVAFGGVERAIPMHPKLKAALQQNEEAKQAFDKLRPSLQLEIVRYLSFLKREDTIDKNITKAICFLLGKGPFIGRDHP